MTRDNLDSSTAIERDTALLRAVLEHAGMLVIVFDADGRVCVFNGACQRLAGLRAEEALGRPFWDLGLLLSEEADEVRMVFERLAAGRFPSQHVNHWVARDGTRRLIHWTNTALADAGEVRYVVGTGIDITDARAAEASLRDNEAQLRMLIDHSPALVGHLDREQRFRFANRAYATWFGLEPEAIVGMHVREVIGAEAYATLGPHFARALAGEMSSHDGEVSYARGGSRVVHGVYLPHVTAPGVVDGLFIMSVDLTQSHDLASRLATASVRSQAVLDTAVDGILVIDERGVIQAVNHAAEHMFGYAAAELVGRNVSMLMPEPDASHHDGYLRRHLDTGERRIIGIGREVTGRRKDGALFPIELAVGRYEDGGRPYFTGFTRDISYRKQIEQEARVRLDQLAHVTRTASLSELASGIAHEVNQPLTAIVTTAQACLRMLDADRATPELIRRALEQMVKQGTRAGDVIHGLRELLRKGDNERRTTLDPNALIREVLALLSHELTQRRIEVRLELDDTMPPQPLNKVQIEQVLFNLVRNAVEAMAETDGPRRLSVRCRRIAAPAGVEIQVGDTGPGLAPDVRARLFEPFLTTKPQGMGQGLAISRSLVQAHGGTLEWIDDGRSGATFRVFLPGGGPAA